MEPKGGSRSLIGWLPDRIGLRTQHRNDGRGTRVVLIFVGELTIMAPH
jgi:hypothetical protein